jgi:hypothetical protein
MRVISIGSLLFLICVSCLLGSISCITTTAPLLGGCARFALHGGAGVSASGGSGTLIYGDVGGDNAITGFPPAQVSSGYQVFSTPSDTPNTLCMNDKTIAYNAAKASTCTSTLQTSNTGLVNCSTTSNGTTTYTYVNSANCTNSGGTIISSLSSSDLSGLTLVSGTYCTASGFMRLTSGSLTLDGGGSYDSVFIFQCASDIITSTNTNIILINGAQSKNIYWATGSAVTLADSSTFRGTILAHTGIVLGTSTTLIGRALAGTSVTMAGNDRVVLPELTSQGGSNFTGPYTYSNSSSSTGSFKSSSVCIHSFSWALFVVLSSFVLLFDMFRH